MSAQTNRPRQLLLAGGVAAMITLGQNLAVADTHNSEGHSDDAVMTPSQIEADWLLQDVVRNLPAVSTDRRRAAVVNITTQQDAAGGCDGVKDGTYGFHTSNGPSPWWQVDLGERLPLDRIVIYNRCDGNVEDRVGRLKVLLSDDG